MSAFQFDQATHTTLLGTTDSGLTYYTGHASNDWTIGTVPNVSYVLSNIFDAVLKHYSERYQKHPIALNSYFFGKTIPGPLVVVIQELKSSSKGYCICQAALKQHKNIQQALPTTLDEYRQTSDDDMIVKVHGIFTMGNMEAETGKTHYHKNPKAPSRDTMIPVKYPFMTDLVDAYIEPSTLPYSSATGQPIYAHSMDSDIVPGQTELSQSMAFADGRPIDVKSLAYYADMFIPPPALLGADFWKGPIWCATMQLEILFKRIPQHSQSILAHFKVPHIINNRFDLDGELFDAQGNILAVTRHQCLILDWTRSMVPKM
ncbi:unnamed protein product [Absidia cylindrospora]